MNNDEQLEAEAVTAIKKYTDDVYVGPDIKSECIKAMVNRHADDMVYLHPVENTNRRVIAALLKSADVMSEVSKVILPYGYAIGQCISNDHGQVAVKWYHLTSGRKTLPMQFDI